MGRTSHPEWKRPFHVHAGSTMGNELCIVIEERLRENGWSLSQFTLES